MPGNGIACYHGSNVIIRGNVIHDEGQDGLKLDPAGYMLIEGNRVYNHGSVQAHGDGIQISTYEVPGPLIIRNNIFGDNTQDIFLEHFPSGGRWGDIYIYNNIVYNSQFKSLSDPGFYNGIIAGGSMNSLYIYGNTCYYKIDGNGCIASPGDSNEIGTLRVENNVMYQSIYNVNPGASASQIQDYNLFDVDGSVSGRTWYMSGWVDLNSFRSSHPGAEVHSKTGSVRFKDAANLDFHIISTSDAIDSGASLSSVAGITFSSDKDGISRPQGSGWDIGAYEYSSGACVSSCTGKACGSDGCGGSCGMCTSGYLCSNSQCVSSCTPSCTGRICGDNGCGGSCGTCNSGYTCTNNQCVANACNPSWTCTAWSSCSNGQQIRTCMDSNGCGNTTGKPAVSQFCGSTEIIIDNKDPGFSTTGNWWVSGYPGVYGSDALGSYVNQGYTATWTPSVSGTYAVYAWWTAGDGRVNDAKYSIASTTGTANVTANQKTNGGQWNLLGTFALNSASKIMLSDASTDQNYVAGSVSDSVCADAIRLVPTASCSDADTDCNGCISQAELMLYISKWKAGNISLADLMGAISQWKKGC
jgi:hypothetical protein